MSEEKREWERQESALHERISALEQELNETRLLELSVRRRLDNARDAALRLEGENEELRGQIVALQYTDEGEGGG